MSLERGYNRILILEDDVIFTEDPHEILENNKNKLDNWDMLYFGGTEENDFGGQIVGAYAYCLNKKSTLRLGLLLVKVNRQLLPPGT